MNHRQTFQTIVKQPDTEQLFEAVRQIKQGDEQSRLIFCAALAWVAYSCPAATDEVYDLIAQAWMGENKEVGELQRFESVPIPESFWATFWQVIDGPADGYDALTITEAVAALGGAVSSDFGELAERHAMSHNGAANAHQQDMPGMTDLAALGEFSEGTLGKTLYNMLVENGYDPEVLDRDAIKLSELPPALRYLNTRILQMHDVWHLVAGYETTGIQEIAISSFQLAQFGHNYSSMFLAVVLMISHEKNPQGFNLLMQIIIEAWRHGRETPSMMAIQWEDDWTLSIEEVRRKHNISPIQSQLPVDLFETFQGGSLWKKLRVGWQVHQFNRRLRAA